MKYTIETDKTKEEISAALGINIAVILDCPGSQPASIPDCPGGPPVDANLSVERQTPDKSIGAANEVSL